MKSLNLRIFLACFFAMSIILTSAARAAPMLDVMVLVDGSGSISDDDFLLQKDAVSHLFGSFSIASDAARFGLIEYSTSVTTHSGLSGNAASLSSALDAMGLSYGQTNHAGSLGAAQTELQNNARGGVIPQVVILLTDGQANEPNPLPLTLAFQEAEDLKNAGAYIFTLGFGSQVDEDDLLAYSSGVDFAYLADDFTGGLAAMDDIVFQLNALTASSVDAPPAIYLLSLGLAGLTLRRRRRPLG